jgi:AraC-like DNA-binding protein
LELLDSQSLVHRNWSAQRYDSWSHDLNSICGHFNPVTVDRADVVLGAAHAIDVSGMNFAHVSNNLDRIYRTAEDIRRDAHEHLFLIVQLEGKCGVEQIGRQSVLDTGDCILVDSTKPTTFHFGGHFSNHLSMHLPRQLMYSDGRIAFDIARKLDSVDPMAVMLRALIAKIMSVPNQDAGSRHLRDLIFDATRQAFIAERHDLTPPSMHESAAKRLEVIDVLIDRHLTESELGARWLADQIGVSIRTLQEDFQGIGVTCTTVIRDKRLRLAREKIEHLKAGKTGTIAEVAYSTGFNDISYFNRSFKEMFACAPSDLLKN